MYTVSSTRRAQRRRRYLGNRAAPDDGGLIRAVNDGGNFQSPLLDIGGGGGGSIASIAAAADAAFPNTYDANTGTYTWNDNSWGNQTINAIDASQQGPAAGFLPAPIVNVISPALISQTPAAPAVTVTPAPAVATPAQSVPSWFWWVAGGVAAVAILRRR